MCSRALIRVHLTRAAGAWRGGVARGRSREGGAPWGGRAGGEHRSKQSALLRTAEEPSGLSTVLRAHRGFVEPRFTSFKSADLWIYRGFMDWRVHSLMSSEFWVFCLFSLLRWISSALRYLCEGRLHYRSYSSFGVQQPRQRLCVCLVKCVYMCWPTVNLNL